MISRTAPTTRLLLVSALVVGLGDQADAASRYTLTDLGASPLGDRYTDSRAVYNPDAGTYVAPQVDDAGRVTYGTGRTADGAYGIQSVGVNGAGSIQLTGPTGQTTTIFPWHENTVAGGVNASGEVVGWFDGDRAPNAFIYKPTPDFEGKLPSEVFGVAPGFAKDIPGAYYHSQLEYAFGVNESGQVVGAAGYYLLNQPLGPHPDLLRAMISDGVTTTDLNTLIDPNSGWLLTSATSINDLGPGTK